MRDGLPRVGVVGTGRLGDAVLRQCRELGLPVVVTASSSGWHTDDTADVLVDASSPEAHDRVLRYCAEHNAALVECVSNLDSPQWKAIHALATSVPVLRATNLAIGHHLQRRLVAHLAAIAPSHPETSVWERHPTTKAHRPSATAIALADVWTAASGREPADVSSSRAGLTVSEHEVTWTWAAETVTVRHSVGSFTAAATGAVRAVTWLNTRAPGLYDTQEMYDDLISTRGA
ncbi:4-hydroxy-tetrahydrodipicolinate reductase [Saccharothrix ecbatanensis]|uniref:4-hydroxy-tetrahydrodipicolinate reductase n=1 Tax=Saccharothrix ecbatanensis TaxID=1105145 RepID=A0A7W9HKI5_9PSEU|nr:dihydrodipicolinate reductase C-terminal domain-containing protein [Saccharothrix ecbatanensis]MBB5803810.1 4-hydroxy-tetrahydrodipicolinate reductase [Saccharothrix ecbatanensis]